MSFDWFLCAANHDYYALGFFFSFKNNYTLNFLNRIKSFNIPNFYSYLTYFLNLFIAKFSNLILNYYKNFRVLKLTWNYLHPEFSISNTPYLKSNLKVL